MNTSSNVKITPHPDYIRFFNLSTLRATYFARRLRENSQGAKVYPRPFSSASKAIAYRKAKQVLADAAQRRIGEWRQAQILAEATPQPRSPLRSKLPVRHLTAEELGLTEPASATVQAVTVTA